MGSVVGANWIGGRGERARGGGFEPVRSLGAPREELGSWPTSGPEDVEWALDALDAAGVRAGPRDVGRFAGRAARWLEGDDAGLELVARRIGIERKALAAHWRARVSAPSHPANGARGRTSSGTALVAPHWTELVSAPLEDVRRELALGRTVLLVSDPRAPMLVDLVLTAWLEAGLPTERVALLHGLTREGLERALVDARVVSVRAGGGRERIAHLRRVGGEVPEQRLRLLRSSAAEIGPDDDPREAAERIAELAFAPGRTLFGQRHGQVGRVWCPARLFSRFTEALLETIESGPLARPRALIDRSAAEEVRRWWARGLDEGATLVSGGVAGRGAREACVPPTVFTNVEPHMRFLRRQAPMPILGLLRT